MLSVIFFSYLNIQQVKIVLFSIFFTLKNFLKPIPMTDNFLFFQHPNLFPLKNGRIPETEK